MASSTRTWAAFISLTASLLLFFIIVFQFPLFRTPCRVGMCTTPILVTSCQLIATEICPQFVVKALLYPGAIAKAFIKNNTLPNFSDLLDLYNLSNLKKGPTATDFHHLEILAGSYLTVAGAILGLLRPGRMSLCGTLLIIWGFVREAILRKYANMNPMKGFYIHPLMPIAVLCACLSIRKDVRNLLRCSRTLRSKSKSM